MANIAYFEIPANNVDRAKHFYHSLFGWKITPTTSLMDASNAAAIQYHDIITGPATDGAMNMGGMYRRQLNEEIRNFVMVDDVDPVLAKVGNLNGRIRMPKTEIPGVGTVAIIEDTEGNSIGIWKPVH